MILSNSYMDCRVVNLDPNDPRVGPFVVTQNAVDPEDPAQRENLYLLRRDGTWIEYATHALTPQTRRVPVVFDSLGEIVKLIEELPTRPRTVRTSRIDRRQLRDFLQHVSAEGGMLAHIRGNVARYKAHKAQKQ